MYLEKINDPSDLKKLDIPQLNVLADEVRSALINKLSKVGGHIGPNLGVVELTIALHYVFDSPKDKIIFDVSHQSYAHKILTGRRDAFLKEEHFNDVTGYTNPKESEHDVFIIGHTSTSISMALGIAKERDLAGEKYNTIAFIGDGSISGGEALEGLNIAGEYDGNLIIILNDNDQSIAENHGGIYRSLKELRETNGKSANNPFTAFGLDYRYLEDGHDISKLIDSLVEIKDTKRPIVFHVHTIKGKGLKYAEEDRENWHAGGGFNVADGSRELAPSNDMIFNAVSKLLDTNKHAVAIAASTPGSMDFTKERREKYAKRGQFVDVGIAEESAVAIASGIAKAGGVAVFSTFAQFFQRTYDQIAHDVCLNNSSIIMLAINPGVYGMNSNTHTALQDITFFSHIPNLTYLAPTTAEEFESMFNFVSSKQIGPVAIRVMKNLKRGGKSVEVNDSLLKAHIEKSGKKIAIFAVGVMLPFALNVYDAVKEKFGLEITIINPRSLSTLDKTLLEKLKINHTHIITIEDGYTEGGYGQTLASFYGDSDIKVQNFGISKEFHTDFDADELLAEHGISLENMLDVIGKILANS